MDKCFQRRTHHVIYKTTCVVTGKYYIGMHSTDNLSDGYLGSGQYLRKSLKKYGKSQHLFEILEHFPDRESLANREEQIITKELREDLLCMNLRSGGTGNYPGTPTKEETRAKLSMVSVGKRKSPSHCESIRAARIGVSSSNKSKNGKRWLIIHPNSDAEEVAAGLLRWAKDRNLNYRRLRASRITDGFLAVQIKVEEL